MLSTARLRITVTGPGDRDALIAFRTRNARHLAPWEPLRPEGWNTAQAWDARLAAQTHDIDAGRLLPFVARQGTSDAIVAHATLSNIARGPFQACTLGYAVDGGAEGQGLMAEMLTAVLAHAFGDFGLHRVMANHLPENERSARLLARLGFEREGYARDYLQIAGRWRDHVLTSKIAP